MPVAWADYQGEPLALGFEVRIPNPAGGEYVMPFGSDPLTGRNRIDLFPPGGVRGRRARPCQGKMKPMRGWARQGFPPEMYKLAMDRAGINYMVVYPSIGLLTSGARPARGYRGRLSSRL